MSIFLAPSSGGSPGGSDTQLQFNNSGSFAGVTGSSVDGSGNITIGTRWISSLNGAASAPPLSLTGTWFTGGTATTTKPHVLIEPAGTTSTAWSTSGTGLGVNAASGFTGNLLDLQVNGTSYLSMSSTSGQTGGALTVRSGGTGGGTVALSIRSSSNAENAWITSNGLFNGLGVSVTNIIGNALFLDQSNQDVILRRDAANTLAQRNGTNAQTFRVYNTYTSATNYELGKLEWASNVFRIGTEKGSGGGTARAVEVQTDSITRLALDTTGSVRVVTGLTVATLPATPTVGMIARVTDATAPAVGSVVAGGGSAAALVWYNGTNWTVLGV